jgi:hypothetical protein
MLTRVAVWFAEMMAEALLLGLSLSVLLSYDPNEFVKDSLIYSVCVAYMGTVTGYLFTTLVIRVMWKSRMLWSHSAAATALFFVHFEIMNISVGGAFYLPDRVRIRAVGAFIVFACSFAGSIGLRRRTALAASQSGQK